MIGDLYKKQQPNKWFVAYDIDGFTKTELPLHPDSVDEISNWEQIFDNIEARIADNQKVEFEIVNETYDDGKGCTYAKLIFNEEK